MKKILIILIVFVGVLFLAVELATSSINEVVTKEDLPQDVYENTEPFNLAHSALQDFFDPLNQDDNYTKIETFMNYMIYDSIKENLNASYDPLGTCDTDECKYIMVTDHMLIDYAFATLTEDDQIILTVSLKRESYPNVETAVHLYFDITTNTLDASFTLTLDVVKLADKTISQAMLDRMMSYVDKDSIESSITYGELNLDDYTFTVYLLEI